MLEAYKQMQNPRETNALACTYNLDNHMILSY